MITIFGSKNRKIVNRWHKEHGKIVDIAHKVLAEYSKNNHANAKKYLKKLNDLAVDHVMSEDIELFHMVHDSNDMNYETEQLIKEFIQSFKQSKLELMQFLGYYSKPEIPLNDTFFQKFNKLVDALSERIEFEEKHLYSKLKTI